jgi:pSer/pThr/pTyr-binding forkhead associated (FHA) protein
MTGDDERHRGSRGRHPSLASGGGRVDDYLLCIDGERSWKVPVPVGTELSIGRDVGAGLRLTDALASRHHARCLAAPDGLRLVDLGSRHGTVVNGERIVGSRLLRSGDVVSIGNATLVLHRTARAVTSAVVEREALVRRLDDELARARHYGREVGVVVVRSQAPADVARASLAVGGLLPPVAFTAALAPHHLGRSPRRPSLLHGPASPPRRSIPRWASSRWRNTTGRRRCPSPPPRWGCP